MTNSGTAVSESPIERDHAVGGAPAPQRRRRRRRGCSSGTHEHERDRRELERVDAAPGRAATRPAPGTRASCRGCPCTKSRRSSRVLRVDRPVDAELRGCSASTDSCVANGPSTLRPTSPGSSCAAANTIMLSSNSVTSASAEALEQEAGHQRAPAHAPAGRRGAGPAARPHRVCHASEVLLEVRPGRARRRSSP